MTLETIFKIGDKVRINDSEKNHTVYQISKIKKSEEGFSLYLLKTVDSPISLLYYESKESNLEKVE